MQLTTRTTIILTACILIVGILLGMFGCNAYWKGKVPVHDTTISIPQKEIVNVYHDTGSIKIVKQIVPRLDSFISFENIGNITSDTALSNALANAECRNLIDSLLIENRTLWQILNTSTSYTDTNYFPHARTVTEIQVYKNALQRTRTSLIDTLTQNSFKLSPVSAFNLKPYYGGSLGWQQSTGLPYLGAVIGLKLPTNQIFLLNASINTKGQSLYTATYVVPFKK